MDTDVEETFSSNIDPKIISLYKHIHKLNINNIILYIVK
jgi:hypothetical protein